MTTTDSLPQLPGSQSIPRLPYWKVEVNVKDSNGDPVPPFAGQPITTFLIVADGAANHYFPGQSDDPVFAADGVFGAAVLANLKSFFEGLDWDAVMTALAPDPAWDTPLSLDSVVITQYEGSSTDITPT